MNPTTFLALAIAMYQQKGEEALRRAVTPNEKWVASICARTGADVGLAIAERDEAAVQFVQVIKVVAKADSLVFNNGLASFPVTKASKLPSGFQLPNLADFAVLLYRTFGKAFVTRALTVPFDTVKAVCAKTGADPIKTRNAAEKWTEEFVEFIESLLDDDFVDPDPEPEA